MKYRKKPIIVEAYQTDVELDIETLEGIMHANVGDYIITGVNGEKYPCKPDIFEKTYELVEESNYKISKGLEALERIKNIPLYHVEQDTDETYDGMFEYSYHEEYDGDIKDIYPGEINTIEDALKRLENYEKNEDFYKDVTNYAFLSEKDKIKKLKALEIIVNKNVDLQKLRKCFWKPNYTFAPLDFYNAGMFRPEYILTQEEYALLREVL